MCIAQNPDAFGFVGQHETRVRDIDDGQLKAFFCSRDCNAGAPQLVGCCLHGLSRISCIRRESALTRRLKKPAQQGAARDR
jgi:hypothetical protein